MPPNLELIKAEVINSLYEWAVNGDHNAHVRFRQKSVQEIVSMTETRSHSSAVNYEHLRCNFQTCNNTSISDQSISVPQPDQKTGPAQKLPPFPKNYEDAIRYVLQSELQVMTIHVTKKDKLHMLCKAPYRKYFSGKKGKITGYLRQPGFGAFEPEKLDPLKRFRWIVRLSQEEIWYRRWFLDRRNEELLGIVFEAILACHAIYKEPCFNCKYRNCLRWMGGSKATAWQDLVCTVCNSIYELKTKENMDTIEWMFARNAFTGGSFRDFYLLQNAIQHQRSYINSKLPPSDQKFYLVVMPRTFSENMGKKFYPVFCTGIDFVLPKIKSNYFRPKEPPNSLPNDLKRIYREMGSVGSKIRLKMATKRVWFQLPRWDEPIGWSIIMEEVYIKQFGKDTFDRMEEAFYEMSDEDSDDEIGSYEIMEDEGCSTPKSGHETDNSKIRKITEENEAENVDSVSDLKSQLESLKHGDENSDDWEDIYDSD